MTTEAPRRRTLLGPVLPTRLADGGLSPLRGTVVLDERGEVGARQATNAAAGLEHSWRMLEAAGTVGNFVLAATDRRSGYAGDSYIDSDVYKWLEAASWQQQRGLSEPVERMLERGIDLLAAAQRPDGYLNTWVQVHGLHPWDPTNRHEFYNLGHLIQAGVAAARSGGSERLFEIAVRAADQLERACTGPANTWHVGHPEIEMALTELYRTTGEQRYLDLASRLLEFRAERRDVLVGSGLSEWEDVLLPMPWETELTGHAVCALYLTAGMTDLLAEEGDPRIAPALDAKWEDMVRRKSYVTGNVGSRHAGEAFGYAYELPSGRAYCETCAGIGILMWCWRLLLLRGDAAYADYFEKVLYNAVFAGVGLDGRSFFYANPLESHADIERLPWFRCSCCPTNVMRLLAQLEHYVATQDARGVQLQQLASSHITAELDGPRRVAFAVATDFPLTGSASIRIEDPGRGEWSLALRCPSWLAGSAVVRVNGEPVPVDEREREGYLTIRRVWSSGDDVEVELPMEPAFVEANWRVRDLRGSLAVTRGPLVYCAESHDQPDAQILDSSRIVAQAGLQELPADGGLGDHVRLTATVALRAPDDEAPLYRRYEPASPHEASERRAGEASLELIPYYLWANRGKSRMRVWFDEPLS